MSRTLIVGLLSLSIASCDASSARERELAARAELERRVDDLTRALEAERASHESDLRGADQERERLQCDLADLRGKLVEQQSEFLKSMQSVAAIRPDALPPTLSSASTEHGPQSTEAPANVDADLAKSREESANVMRSLRNLIRLEEVYGLDLLEIGALHEGWTGPVVFRELDTQGRMTGGLYAERMHFEGSRAGRSLSIVLEDGYETRSGERVPFENGAAPTGTGGVRRIELAHVDPERWLESAPQLFGPKAALDQDDDGQFDVEATRRAVNQLLAEDASAGHYKLKQLSGVVGGVLRKVHLEYYDRDDKLERRFFADRMSVRAENLSVVILLEDGVQLRGDEKAPFLDGRLRIYLPRALAADWKAAGVPGLIDAPSVSNVLGASASEADGSKKK